MKKILITGGNGFLGKKLGKILSLNNKVLLGSRNNEKNILAIENSDCDFMPLDITNIESVRDCINFFKPDIVIHTAATKYVQLADKYPFETIDINILGSQNIARVAIDNNVPIVIGISTDKSANTSGTFYGITKSVMEKLFCNLNGKYYTKFTCVRFGNIAWSTGSCFPIWEKMMKSKKIVESTGPEMKRFFFSLTEASDLVIKSMQNIEKLEGKILTKKMKYSKISDILKIWSKHFNVKWKKIKQRPGDLDNEILISEFERENTKEIILDKEVFYLIDPMKKFKNCIKKNISTKNAIKLNNNEILSLIVDK